MSILFAKMACKNFVENCSFEDCCAFGKQNVCLKIFVRSALVTWDKFTISISFVTFAKVQAKKRAVLQNDTCKMAAVAV